MSHRPDASSANGAGRGGDRGVGVGEGGGVVRAWRSGAFWGGFGDGMMRTSEVGALLLGVLLTSDGNMPAAAYPVALAIYLRLLRKGGGR